MDKFTRQMNVKLSKDVFEKFQKKAEKEGRQVSEVIRQLVSEYINKEKTTKIFDNNARD